MATQSVKIPVELQLGAIKDQINQLRQALGNVKEGTTAYKGLNKTLEQLEEQFLKVQAESKKAFSNQTELTQFRRNFERVSTLANIFQEKLENVRVSDLKINTDSYDAAVKKVQELTEQIKALSSKKIGTIFDGTEIETIARQLKVTFNKDTTFSNLSVSFAREKEKIEKELEDLAKKKKEYTDFLSDTEQLQKDSTTGKLGNSVGQIRQRSTTETVTRPSITRANTALLEELGSLGRISISGIQANNINEYIENVTESVVAEVEVYNNEIREAAVEAEETAQRLDEALAALADYNLHGRQRLTTDQILELSNISGQTIRGVQYETVYRNLQMERNLLDEIITTPEIDWDEATIREAAQRAAQVLTTNTSFQARAFVNEVYTLLQSYGSKLSKTDLAWREDDTEFTYFNRLKQKIEQEGSEAVQALEEINNKIQSQTDLNQRAAQGIKDIETVEQQRETTKKTLETEKLEENNKVLKEGSRLKEEASKNNEWVSNTTQKIGESTEDMTDKLNLSSQALVDLNEKQKRLDDIQSSIKQWFGFNEILNLTKDAIRSAINHIRELDEVMTQIAVVTDMTQKELWDQIDTYSALARQYGATTAGVYEVSQLYYQQGLQTAEVMQLTEETLKMASIANIDYADATDYMTVAIRGFKLEMSDAQNVVDVYSNIAAITASDTEELAVAMSKTASSAEAVGSSFENTTAMIALMVETTREAPQNIGSAIKSIISRYGEMTSDPTAIVDSEGEELSLNKVDKALQSVGISLHDTQGQFRDFDDVILELAESWDTIDTNTQRYIATVMAGNRLLLLAVA